MRFMLRSSSLLLLWKQPWRSMLPLRMLSQPLSRELLSAACRLLRLQRWLSLWSWLSLPLW